MLLALAFLAGLASLPLPPQDPLAAALERYAQVASYQVTLRSTHAQQTEVIKYFYKKPGFVRMEFVTPHQGAVLVYDPGTRRVRLRPFGLSESLVLSLSPGSMLVQSASGHRVDESDIGELLKRARRLQMGGRATVTGEETVGGRPTLALRVEGAPGQAEDKTHAFDLYLDAATMLPLKVKAYDTAGHLIEEVLMDDLKTGVHLDDGFFRL